MGLTKNNVPPDWLEDQRRAIKEMIDRFSWSPILRHFDHKREVIIETDASDSVAAGLLSLKVVEGVLHLLAYLSKTHTPAECNYDIYDK